MLFRINWLHNWRMFNPRQHLQLKRVRSMTGIQGLLMEFWCRMPSCWDPWLVLSRRRRKRKLFLSWNHVIIHWLVSTEYSSFWTQVSIGRHLRRKLLYCLHQAARKITLRKMMKCQVTALQQAGHKLIAKWLFSESVNQSWLFCFQSTNPRTRVLTN